MNEYLGIRWCDFQRPKAMSSEASVGSLSSPFFLQPNGWNPTLETRETYQANEITCAAEPLVLSLSGSTATLL